MTFYRNIFGNTRPYLIATAAGVAICSSISSVQAQQAGGHAPVVQYASEPRLLPQPEHEAQLLHATPQQVRLTAGQTNTPYDVNEEGRNGSASSSRSSRQVSFSDRFGRFFKGKPTTPPVDPGMNYPKASETVAAPAGPPPAPGASNMAIPSIPPTYGHVTAAAPAQQPALFQAPTSANAIGGSDIPAAPPEIPSLSQLDMPPTAAATSAASNGVPLKNIPELKIIMASEGPPRAPGVDPEIVQNSNLPKLDFNDQIPATPPQIAPGEPTATAQTPAPAKSADPFADLFPEDKGKPATETKVAKQEPATQSPYTGQSLNVAAGQPAMPPADANLLPPPPMEEQVNLVKTPAPQLPSVPEVKTASAAPLTAPSLPTLDISSPNDLPKLTATKTTPAELKPIQSAPPATESPRSNDQQSKMELIASRKNLKGLKGFCPVVLRDERDLIDSSFEFMVSYNGHDYALSSAEARSKFLSDPAKYAPAEGGCDVIHLALTGEHQEGSLEHAVWYKGRLYLFNGIETMETFVAAPSSHATTN